MKKSQSTLNSTKLTCYLVVDIGIQTIVCECMKLNWFTFDLRWQDSNKKVHYQADATRKEEGWEREGARDKPGRRVHLHPSTSRH